jgi:hypothetical protein
MSHQWGPLAALAGEWAGEAGVDVAFSHTRGQSHDTPYREVCQLKPFGPVDNGRQSLFGLDYRSAMWRDDEANPFHTEVGYWLWDSATGEVVKGFVVPRGIVTLAGGIAAADATTWTMHAEIGHATYAIGENSYLSAHASSRSYDVTISVTDEGWSYNQVTSLRMDEFSEPFAHTDKHVLRRTAAAEFPTA